jgi:fibronectin type 3 domain-containing protein
MEKVMSARNLRNNVMVSLSFLMLLTTGCNWFDSDESPPEYTVGGTVTGLTDQLTLQNNAADDLVIAADGAFEFATPVTNGADYAVTVSAQPAGQMCSITNGAGTIASASVNDIAVTCVDLVTGLFVDDLVVGLVYWCSSGTWHETTADGEFSCPLGDEVAFWLGTNRLGPVSSSSIITPYTLFPDDSLAALNLARLLQSLDSDGDPDNPFIVIDDALVASLPADLDFSLPVEDFDQAVTINLVSLEVAQQNLNDAIAQYTPGNTAPNAAAGADQSVSAGSTVTLNGAGSSDADGDGLTYRWSFVSRPAGSGAALVFPFTVGPSFVADITGSYVISLIVSDGTVTDYDTVMVTAGGGAGVPAAPQGLQAVAGDALVALSWNAVDGATGYMIYWNTTGNVTASDNWTGPLTSTVINLGSLSNGTTYYYKVAAVNASGEGPLSAEAFATPQAPGAGLPAMPEGVQAFAGDSLVTLNWTAVSGATSYTVYWNTTGGVDNSDAGLAAGSSPGFTHTGLTNDTTYYYRVAASNASGEGPLSAERSATPVADTPAVPAAPQGVQATAGDTEVTVSWTTVADATNYTVYWNTTGGVSATDASLAAGSSTQVAHTGLTNGTTYYYRISASNASGEGALSTEASAMPVAPATEIPGQPQGLQAVAGDAAVTLTWTAVTDADTYTVYWTDTGVFSQGGSIDAGNSTRFTHNGLSNGTTYYYRVSATNTQGEGVQSGVVNAVPVIPVPLALQATIGDGQVQLDWAAVEPGSYSYTVYWATTGNVTTSDNSIDAGTNLQIAHTGLTAGKDYYYRVSATGTSGESELSAEVSSSQQSNWQWSHPRPHGNSFHQIIWGNNEFIAVTDAGGILTSPYGSTWTRQNSGTSGRLNSIVWSGSRYVAVGEGGAIVTSTDGLVWSVQSAPVGHQFLDIIWNGSLFVAAGTTIITSPDGVTWTEANHSSAYFMNSISWNENPNDKLLVLFENGPSGRYFHTSTDGMTWSRHATTLSTPTDIVWDGSKFVAPSGGSAYTSTNGIDWADLGSINVSLYGLIWDGSQFIGVGNNGSIATSPDAVNWTTQTSNTTEQLRRVASNGSQYVAGGWVGLILTSTNATTWTHQLPTLAVTRLTLSDIVWANSQFVAVGGYGSSNINGGRNSSVILTSPDGDTWTVRPSGSTDPILEVIWTGSQFVAVGMGGILTSTDGETWTIRYSGSGVVGRGITWNGSKFVVVGGYQYVLTSDDAITWTSHAISSTVGFDAVQWNGERFVAVGGNTSGYNVMTSFDGENWTAPAGVFPRLDDVIWANNQFVAAAFERTLTSPDGLTWTTHYLSDPSGYMVKVEWDGTQYVSSSAEGPIHTSPDGANWTRQNVGTENWLNAIAWDDNGKAVAVGLWGTILTNSSW